MTWRSPCLCIFQSPAMYRKSKLTFTTLAFEMHNFFLSQTNTTVTSSEHSFARCYMSGKRRHVHVGISQRQELHRVPSIRSSIISPTLRLASPWKFAAWWSARIDTSLVVFIRNQLSLRWSRPFHLRALTMPQVISSHLNKYMNTDSWLRTCFVKKRSLLSAFAVWFL